MTVILITLYSKMEQSDILLQEIQAFISAYEQEQQDTEVIEDTPEITKDDAE